MHIWGYWYFSQQSVVSSAYLRLLIFLPAILIPAFASSSLIFLIMSSAYKLNKQGVHIQPWHTFSYLELVCCSMSSSNCCFFTCIQISQEASQVVWYSHLLKNFPKFIVIHIVKVFGIVNKADVFMEFSCFFDDPMDVGNSISGIWYLLLRIMKIEFRYIDSVDSAIISNKRTSLMMGN